MAKIAMLSAGTPEPSPLKKTTTRQVARSAHRIRLVGQEGCLDDADGPDGSGNTAGRWKKKASRPATSRTTIMADETWGFSRRPWLASTRLATPTA
jgi:hypothetical protein